MATIKISGFNRQVRCNIYEFESSLQHEHVTLISEKKAISVGLCQVLINRAFVKLKKTYNYQEIQLEKVFWEHLNQFVDKELPKYKRIMEKNFGMDEEKFQTLLQNLRKGDETIFEQIFLSHFQDCQNFLHMKFNISNEDAYDVTMHTLIEFRKRLLEDKVVYGNVRFLFNQMAIHYYLKWAKKKMLGLVQISRDIPEMGKEEFESYISTLNLAWGSLCEECASLLNEFYYKRRQLKDIAESNAKSDIALRKQKQRCLEKLRRNFFKELNIQ